uniref:Vacuolar protein sorting-associated protein 72 homolog n=1 Tax=Anisakis simplex TaxID=6269 RepID=A0A0M3JR46_ANISI
LSIQFPIYLSRIALMKRAREEDSEEKEQVKDENVKKVKLSKEETQSSEGHSHSEDNSSSGDESSDESTEIELMVKTRERRSNAGNKMAQLMDDTEQEDEFYKNTYGGNFLEDDADDAYESPVESDHDEVDSDFDRSEQEEETISDAEDGEKRKRRNVYKEPQLGGDKKKRKSLLEKNRKWVVARMGGPTVAANTVSPETQAERLEEARETERMNLASLQKYEQFELERKKKSEKINAARKLKPPYISHVDGPNGKWIVVPEVKKFVKPERKMRVLCSVTSRPAKYRDPLTGLPYATVAAFKLIRQKYIEHLRTIKNNSAVTTWLSEHS